MITKKQKEIEFWEHFYLNQIHFILTKDELKMINFLNSKDDIKDDWISVYKKKSCDIDRGAERIYHWFLHVLGMPNSAPIGADMMYETSNAFIHLDVKTTSFYTKKKGVRVINTGDFRGVVSIGHNQTSYTFIDKEGKARTANLPPTYKTKNKYCLTYIIHLIYDKGIEADLEIKALVLISIPNGMLKNIYTDRICATSKEKPEAFRYHYHRNPYFQTIDGKPYRFKELFLHDSLKETPEKIYRIKKT